MNLKPQKMVININDCQYKNWKSYLKNKLIKVKSKNIEIDCGEIDLTCSDILDLQAIAIQYNCEIISFCSTSSNTIISSQSLGYKSHFIFESHSNSTLKLNKKDLNISKTDFHQGTIRSGEYLDSAGDLLILGDVNPGAKVRAEGSIMIWGKLLGIAHAGRKGNSKATISALQLRPVQLRIAEKVARGPNDKPLMVFAEQARIDSEEIIISPLEIT